MVCFSKVRSSMQLSSSSDMLYATQRYWQEMESIWEQVNQLPEGQDKVVMSQLWQLGKTSAALTPEEFPALVAHGVLVEQLVDGRLVWRPVPPSLKEFWRVGITLSHAHGYRLQPRRAFQANLQATIHLHRPVQSQAEPLLRVGETSKNEHSQYPEASDLETRKATVKLAA
jgi:hypothetical protein